MKPKADPALNKAILGVDPFKGLPTALVAMLEQQATIVTAAAGKILAKPSETLHSLVYVLEGELQTSWQLPDGKEVICSVIRPGQALGWLTVIDNRAMQHVISTVAAVKLLLIPMELARHILRTVPAAAEFVMRQMAESIRRLELQSRILGMPNAFQRVYIHLFHLVGSSVGPNELKLPKQQEIASFVNTSRETVSRAVQLLIKHGVITKDGRLVKVQKIELLKEAAESGAEALEAA